eukprot:SAG11_NODE_6887_length_1231_cov_1.163428_1_plen_65_part_10
MLPSSDDAPLRLLLLKDQASIYARDSRCVARTLDTDTKRDVSPFFFLNALLMVSDFEIAIAFRHS